MPDATTTPAASAPKSASAVFISRLISTVILWGLIITALAFRLDWPLLVLATAFGLLGTWEYAGLSHDGVASRPFTRLLLLLSAAYWIAIGWMGVLSRGRFIAPQSDTIPLWIDAISILLVVLGTFGIVLSRPLDGENTLRRVIGTVFGFIFTALALGFLVRILFLPGTQSGAHLMLLVIAVVKFGDMGAYAIGSWLGRHKMIPHISPAKSWEGAGGALLGSVVAASLMMIFDEGNLTPLTWRDIFPFAIVLCIVGALGDLAESILKRCHGVKDSGHTLPGIGGILDLTDSLLFAAPVAYFYLRAIS